MLAFKTLQAGARAPENLAEVRTVAIAQLQHVQHEAAALEDGLRRAGDNLSDLRAARERRDAAHAEWSVADERCREVRTPGPRPPDPACCESSRGLCCLWKSAALPSRPSVRRSAYNTALSSHAQS